MRLGMGFWGSKALLSAVELGLFSELAASGPLEVEALRERLGLHDRSARDFFDALVALGMLERADGRYRNTQAAELFLDRAKPSYIGGILEMANARLTWTRNARCSRRHTRRSPTAVRSSFMSRSLTTSGARTRSAS
jgi:hypothetical protein